jgi:hypothetical protein
MPALEHPTVPSPLRVCFVGASTEGWYQSSERERAETILPAMLEVFASFRDDFGARLLATLDDDLFRVGQPVGGQHTWFFMFDVPDLETVTAMVDLFRRELPNGVRLDKYCRLEARVGRAFYPLERP